MTFKLRLKEGEGIHCVRLWGRGAPGRGNSACKDSGVGSNLGFQGVTGLQSMWPRQRSEADGGRRWAREVGRGLPETLGNQEISSGKSMLNWLRDIISHSVCLSGAIGYLVPENHPYEKAGLPLKREYPT